MPISRHNITSVSVFLEEVERLKRTEVDSGNKADFIFRGQSMDDPLVPRLVRLKPKGKLHNV